MKVFFSYNFVSNEGSGFGNAELEILSKTFNYKNIREAEKQINELEKNIQTAILFWKIFEE